MIVVYVLFESWNPLNAGYPQVLYEPIDVVTVGVGVGVGAVLVIVGVGVGVWRVGVNVGV